MPKSVAQRVQKGSLVEGSWLLRRFLADKNQSDVARKLGLNRQYLYQLAHDLARPGLALGCALERLTEGAVPVQSWDQPVQAGRLAP